VLRCGHDGQHIFAVAPQDDALGETIARDRGMPQPCDWTTC
jgi:hypothetical protein